MNTVSQWCPVRPEVWLWFINVLSPALKISWLADSRVVKQVFMQTVTCLATVEVSRSAESHFYLHELMAKKKVAKSLWAATLNQYALSKFRGGAQMSNSVPAAKFGPQTHLIAKQYIITALVRVVRSLKDCIKSFWCILNMSLLHFGENFSS